MHGTPHAANDGDARREPLRPGNEMTVSDLEENRLRNASKLFRTESQQLY